jgi:hypothetical protein
VVVAGSRARAEVRVEKVDVPRDLGELRQAAFDRRPSTGGDDRWRRALDSDDLVRDIAITDDVVVLALEKELVGLDPRSGRRRWATRGLVEWTRPAGRDIIAVFRTPPLDPAKAEQEDAWPRDLARLDGRTGRPRWRTSCGDGRCELAIADGTRVLVHGRDRFVVHDAATGRRRTTIDSSAELAFVEGDIAILSRPPTLEAVSLTDGHTLWQGTQIAPSAALAQRSGAHLVAAADNEVSVFDWKTGERVSTTLLPDGWRASRPLAMSDGRIAVPESNDGLDLLAIVDPRGGQRVILWGVPGEPAIELYRAQLRTDPRAPRRQELSLAEEVNQRLDNLGANVRDPYDKWNPADPAASLPFLRRLPTETYRDAVLERLRHGRIDSPELVELIATADGGKSESAVRKACTEGLTVAVAQLPDATIQDLPRRTRDSLWLMEATRGVLPEAPMRAVGGALAQLLRERWAALSPGGRAALGLATLHGSPGTPWYPEVAAVEELLDESTRFLRLLWRAPYPDVDKALRDVVGAIGPARPCPYPMTDAYHASPRRPPDLSCKPDAPPFKAVRGSDWAVWTSPGLGRNDDLWGMRNAGKSWSEPRYLGDNETARDVLAAGEASTEQRFELLAALAFAARDTDGDGLTDAVEGALGLDPARADTDGDGVPDGRDPSPLCAAPKRPLTRDEQIVVDLAWTELGLRTEAMPALFELPDAPGASMCVEVPTVGGPVIVGRGAAVQSLKARRPELRVYSATVEPLSPEARARVQPFDAILRGKPLSVAGWHMYRGPLNADSRQMVVVLVGGRWRPVAVFKRVIS